MGLWGPDDRTSGVDPFYLAEVKDKSVARSSLPWMPRPRNRQR